MKKAFEFLVAASLACSFSACSSSDDSCETLKKKYEAQSEVKIKEALEAVGPEYKTKLSADADIERGLVKKNFVRVCRALPKDFDKSCLLSEEHEGCKDAAKRFYDEVYED